jgi:metal-responsive CopG/Arc/MetJ family transcriptional regulator
MPRPSRNLTRISVYLPADALTGLDAKAAHLTARGWPATRSDVIRLAVEDYLRELTTATVVMDDGRTYEVPLT